MNERNKFLLIEVLIAIFSIGITLIEIFYPAGFKNIVTQLISSTSWFLGLTFGAVTSGLLKDIKSTTSSVLKAFSKVEENFIYFLTSLAIFTVITAIATNIVLRVFNAYPEFFHLIFVQWFVIVYIWFKVSEKYELKESYIIATELIILACLLLIRWKVF